MASICQVVSERPLEAQLRHSFPGRLRDDQVVALQRPVDRRDRWRLHAGAQQLGSDPPRAPARTNTAQRADHRLKLGINLPGKATRSSRARDEPRGGAFPQVPGPVAVEARARYAASAAHLSHRVARALELQQTTPTPDPPSRPPSAPRPPPSLAITNGSQTEPTQRLRSPENVSTEPRTLSHISRERSVTHLPDSYSRTRCQRL